MSDKHSLFFCLQRLKPIERDAELAADEAEKQADEIRAFESPLTGKVTGGPTIRVIHPSFAPSLRVIGADRTSAQARDGRTARVRGRGGGPGRLGRSWTREQQQSW